MKLLYDDFAFEFKFENFQIFKTFLLIVIKQLKSKNGNHQGEIANAYTELLCPVRLAIKLYGDFDSLIFNCYIEIPLTLFGQ